MIWGPAPMMMSMPPALSGPVRLLPDLLYPAYRLLIIAVGLLVALGLYLFVTRTRAGVLVRAGASNRQMATLMGVRVPLLFLGVFVLGAMLAALAGALLACHKRCPDRRCSLSPSALAGRLRGYKK